MLSRWPQDTCTGAYTLRATTANPRASIEVTSDFKRCARCHKPVRVHHT